MTINHAWIWILLGTGTTVLYLLSQKWSVNLIDPQKPSRSVRLIIGGAFLRWMLIAAAMIIAILHSYTALGIVFLTFVALRFLFLLKYHRWQRVTNPFIQQS